MSSRGRLVIAVVSILIGVAGGLAVNYLRSFHVVYVKLAQPNMIVDVYKDSLGAKSSNRQVLYKVSSNQDIKLKKGVTYDFVVNNSSQQFSDPVSKIAVNAFTNTVAINPDLSVQRLASLLSSERAAIQQAISTKYPELAADYAFSTDHLFEHGDWYGVKLVPDNPDLDQAVMIMHYSNNKWVVAAYPQISIGIPSYPAIPSDVIDAVDQF